MPDVIVRCTVYGRNVWTNLKNRSSLMIGYFAKRQVSRWREFAIPFNQLRIAMQRNSCSSASKKLHGSRSEGASTCFVSVCIGGTFHLSCSFGYERCKGRLFHDIWESRHLKIWLFHSFNMYVLTISLKHRKYIVILYIFLYVICLFTSAVCLHLYTEFVKHFRFAR